MNRYKKANEGIHAPEEVKERAARPARRSRAGWIGGVAAVLAAAILAGVVFWPGGSPLTQTASAAIAEAKYPEMPPYPDESQYFDPATGECDDKGLSEAWDAWWTELRARQDLAPAQDALKDFYAATIPEFLGNSGGENLVYSPLNVYLALAMLAETTGGNSRQQILDLLGVSDVGALRDLANRLWNSAYRDDGAVTTILASSLWLNENVSFTQETMDRLADTYYASSYRGEMGSGEFNEALRDWLNQQTGGLLEEYVKDVAMDPNTVLALATTLYLKVKWKDEFWEERSTEALFHGAAGDEAVTFMNQSAEDIYYWADRFSACGRRFEKGGAMWFLLPDEGVSVNDLLADSQTIDFLTSTYSWENQKYLIVNFSMPKFDVSSRIDLTGGLKNLGVTDVFSAESADFSPMTGDLDVILSEATHAARVKVDEKGVEAAAFTVIMAAGDAMPPEEEIDFVLDRPFLFAITGENDQLLFAGVVNQI